ncbi:MAG TPA: geranylgeranyl reductase family protein [Bryobacteraceae bacterium]|nr:geranylgeranyl reductase family protein [Bryobacteraceae bacterium]
MPGSHYDVVVVGGGPAGAMTAYHLARAGLRVAVFEARRFPRDKACGGGLQLRAARRIPFDISPIVRGTMRRMSVSYGLKDFHTRASSDPLVYTVLRSEFDEHLIRCAELAGAFLFQNTPGHAFHVASGGKLTIETGRGVFTADCLVGADGANSRVRPFLNSRSEYFWQAAVYCEIPEHMLNTDEMQWDCMTVDWGTLPSGYAWAFPKNGYVNLGAGGPTAMAKYLKTYAARFAESSRVVKRGLAQQLKFIGHQLPTLTRATRVAKSSVLLVGDAAGLVEPFTGDGISFACESAEIAARCIRDALGIGKRDLSAYSEEIMRALRDELFSSRKLLSLSVAFPKQIYRLFRYNDRVWQSFCRVLRGEETFEQLKRDVLGRFYFASRAVEWFTHKWENRMLRARTYEAARALSS